MPLRPIALLILLLSACGARPSARPLSEEDVGALGAGARTTDAVPFARRPSDASGAAALTASVDTRPVTWSDAQIGAALEPLRAPIAACTGEQRSFTLRLRFEASGQLASGTARDLDETEGACVRDVLRGLRIDGRVRHAREVAIRFERPAPERALPAADPGPAIRAFLDGQRDVILACAGRAIVPVQARWQDGAISFALRGLEGTDEERCATDALATATGRPQPDGPGGTLVHAVR